MSRRVNLATLTGEQLVERVAAIGVAQDDALLGNEIARFNRLFDELMEIEEELRLRQGDQRRLLMSLYDHANMHVRLNAGKATLPIAPQEARALIEAIAESNHYPQAGDAGMCLWALDEGIFVPE